MRRLIAAETNPASDLEALSTTIDLTLETAPFQHPIQRRIRIPGGFWSSHIARAWTYAELLPPAVPLQQCRLIDS
jgi:hypothetical protein